MKKLIVEIDDKYAGVASMTFTGGIDLWQEELTLLLQQLLSSMM